MASCTGRSSRRGARGALLAALAAVLLAGGLRAAPAGAVGDAPGWGYQLSDQLMSPYCPGRALSQCPSPQAGELRQWILDQERAGVERSAVEAELYRIFGEDTLRQAPRAQGVGLVAYGIPALVLVLGGGLVWLLLRRSARSRPEPEAPTAVDPALLRRVDEELAAPPPVDR